MGSFEAHRLSAPRVPTGTCPKIDAAISEIDSVADTLSKLTERGGALEALRKANGELRDLAHYWRQSAEELASQVDTLEDKVSALEDELDALKSERAAA